MWDFPELRAYLHNNVERVVEGDAEKRRMHHSVTLVRRDGERGGANFCIAANRVARGGLRAPRCLLRPLRPPLLQEVSRGGEAVAENLAVAVSPARPLRAARLRSEAAGSGGGGGGDLIGSRGRAVPH